MNKHRPILLTGAARSGTTWVGTIIAEAKGVKYVLEPFTPFNKSSPLKYVYEFINEDTEITCQTEIKEYLTRIIDSYPEYLAYNLSRIFLKRNFPKLLEKDFYVRNRFRINNFLKSPFYNCTLFKDPFALLSSEWIYHTFDTRNVILLRHPLAMAASYKMENRRFDFNQFRLQTGLMKNYLPQFREQVNTFSFEIHDTIDLFILLWNILYTVIYDLYQKYKDNWYFIRHEDLSLDPVNKFKSLFLYLGLTYTERIEKTILKTTHARKKRLLERDSIENVREWQKRLTKQEIIRVINGTHQLTEKFYSDKDIEVIKAIPQTLLIPVPNNS